MYKTLEEYKEELKDLTKDECYEWMYQMSKQICEAIELLKKCAYDKTDQYIPIKDYKEYQELLEILGCK